MLACGGRSPSALIVVSVGPGRPKMRLAKRLAVQSQALTIDCRGGGDAPSAVQCFTARSFKTFHGPWLRQKNTRLRDLMRRFGAETGTDYRWQMHFRTDQVRQAHTIESTGHLHIGHQ